MNDRGNTGWNPPPGQGMPPNQPPQNVPPAPPYGIPSAPPYGQPSPPPYGQPLPPQYGQPPSGYAAPPTAPPPYGTPPQYSQPYNRPPGPAIPYRSQGSMPPPMMPPVMPAKKRRVWPLVLGIVFGVIVLLVGAIVIWYTTLTVKVTSLEFGKAIVNDKAAQITTTFSATDPEIYAFIGLNATKGNPEIKFVWTLENGIDPATKRPVTNIQIAEYGKNASSTRMYGSIARTGTSPWPTGTYRLDVYVNGVVKKSGTFTVTA